MNTMNTMNTINTMTFIEFEATKGGSRIRSGKYIVASKLENRQHKIYRVGISRDVAKIIRAKDLTHYRIGLNEFTNEVFLIFCKNALGRIVFQSAKKHGDGTRYLAINSKAFCDWLGKHYTLGAEYKRVYFMLSDDMSNSNDYATFKIESKQ